MIHFLIRALNSFKVIDCIISVVSSSTFDVTKQMSTLIKTEGMGRSYLHRNVNSGIPTPEYPTR